MSHSKLPWKEYKGEVTSADGCVICDCGPDVTISKAEAAGNAKLIVRAVNSHADLLAACEAALASLTGYGMDATTRDQLRAAITKARGDA